MILEVFMSLLLNFVINIFISFFFVCSEIKFEDEVLCLEEDIIRRMSSDYKC